MRSMLLAKLMPIFNLLYARPFYLNFMILNPFFSLSAHHFFSPTLSDIDLLRFIISLTIIAVVVDTKMIVKYFQDLFLFLCFCPHMPSANLH